MEKRRTNQLRLQKENYNRDRYVEEYTVRSTRQATVRVYMALPCGAHLERRHPTARYLAPGGHNQNTGMPSHCIVSNRKR